MKKKQDCPVDERGELLQKSAIRSGNYTNPQPSVIDQFHTPLLMFTSVTL